MAFSRSLLIKGIAGGLGACTACAGGVGIYKSVSSSEKLTDKQLIDGAGLNCGLGDNENEVAGTKDCTVKTDGKINVEKGKQKEEGVSFQTTSSGKIKLYKLGSSGNYSNGLKFVVDSGDITLTKNGATPSSITTLGQYETYGIEEKDGKYYLSKKTEADKEKQRELGLDKCEFPASGNKNCSFNTEEIKKVKFDGQQTEGVTLSSEGSVSLRISKTTDEDNFPGGYRFTFTFPSGVDNPSIKANTPTDFKIKKGNGNSLTLEKAWKNNDFAKKAGLDCTNSNACTVTTPGGKLNVKVGDNKKENITSINGGVKVENEQAGYNQGLKFTITGGYVTLNDGEGAVSKLEQFETYEITEENNKYYLTRKTGPEGNIKTSLGLPCDLPSTSSPVDCVVPADQSKDVKFEGKEDQKPSEQITLKIEKTGDSSFPFGYKFTLISDKDVALSSTSTIKKNTDTVFKIKRENDNALSLEKVWKEAKDLAKKIGLTCSGSSEVTCTKSSSSEKLNVKQGTSKREGIENIGNNAKIKAEKDQEGYNQGFKFTIINSSATLTGGVEGTISKLEQFETYEIVEEGGKYYLSRKTGPEGGIKNALGLPEGCNLSDSSVECSITSDQSKNVKFEGKDKGKPTGEIKLKIEKTEDSSYPFGYKFTLLSTKDVELSTSSTIKKNTDTVFKIKRKTSSNEISLEKVWSDINALAGKVGLNCTGGSGDTCTITSTINVKRESVKEEGKSKKDSPSSKIKFSKEQENYSQGFKFEIEGGDFELNGKGSNITKLENFETYEIVEEGGKYYLSRKTKAWVKLREKLGLPNTCNFPTSSPCTITSSQLGSVNFYGKNKNSSITNSGDVKLTIEEDNGYPKGYKFLFKSEKGTISIPRTIPTSSPLKLIKNKEEEFKINESGNDITLTKIFDIHEIAKRVSLDSCDEETKECTLGNKIKIYDESSGELNEKTVKNENNNRSKKISYTEENETYLRFKVSSSFKIQNTLFQETIISAGKYKISKDPITGNYYLDKDNTPDY